MAITCPNGHVNDEGNRFCDQCGAPLGAAPAASVESAQSAPAAATASPGGLACPTCGQENLPGTAFCENCGAPLQPPEPAADMSATAVPDTGGVTSEVAGSTTCPNCGTVNDAANTFCEQCGAALPQNAAASAAGRPPADASAPTAPPAVEAMPEAPAGTAPAAVDMGTPPDVPAPDVATASAGTMPEAPAPSIDAAPPPDGQITPEPAPEQASALMAAATPAPEPAVASDQPAPAPTATAAAPQGQTCANCGAQLPANAKFCLECGTKVEQQPQMVRPTNCQNCGSELPANAKFCLECGTKVELIPAGTERAPVEATYQQQAAESPAAALVSAPSSAPIPASPAAEQTTSAPPAEAAPAEPVTAPTARRYDSEAAAAAAAPVVSPPQAPTAAPPVQPMPAPAPSQPAPMAAGGPRLVAGDGATISLPPQAELIVGREDPISGIHPDVDMTPHGGEAGGVSRRHAVLRQENGNWTVTDLDSTNYTRVDGNRITPHTAMPLHEGARVQFGRVEFTFHAQ